jgi:hypothetical protein
LPPQPGRNIKVERITTQKESGKAETERIRAMPIMLPKMALFSENDFVQK